MSVNAVLLERESHDPRCPECQSGNVTRSTVHGYTMVGEIEVEQEAEVAECRDCGASWSD